MRPEPVCARTSSLIFEMVTEPEPVSAFTGPWTLSTLTCPEPVLGAQPGLSRPGQRIGDGRAPAHLRTSMLDRRARLDIALSREPDSGRGARTSILPDPAWTSRSTGAFA